MARYEGASKHKIYVRDTETDMMIEKECDAAWWVSTPSWAQVYIMEGIRRELESQVAITAVVKEESTSEEEPS